MVNKTQSATRVHLKAAFLMPVSLMIILLFMAFFFFVQRQLNFEIENTLADNLLRVNELLINEKEEDTKIMRLLVQRITENEQIKEAMIKQDRKTLYDISKPTLEGLRTNYEIDHLYFLTPERTALLRVHRPEDFGDTIERSTAIQAEKTHQFTSGIELGPLGTLALRVIMPCFNESELLGYIELSKNIYSMLDDPLPGARTYISLYKRHLSQKAWENGMQARGLRPDWERFPSLVITSPVSDDELTALSELLSTPTHEHFVISVETALGEKTYRAGTIPIFEASGREVGDIIVFTDVTEWISSHRKELRDVTLAAALFTIILTLFSYFLLGRFEKRLLLTQQTLIKEQKSRVREQKKYVKELQATLKETERARSDLQDSFVETIYTMIRAAEFRDYESGAHVRRISHYTKVLAESLGMDNDFCDTIFYASPMHDIGKIGIPDNILLKQANLEPEEWEIMKTHTVIGAQILTGNSSPYLQMGEQIALGHHERWDGSGYPGGLKGDDIPLPARIMQLADVYDALRSKRSYKPPFDHAQTLRIIFEGDERTDPSQFDPEVLAAFQKCSNEFANIFDELALTEEK